MSIRESLCAADLQAWVDGFIVGSDMTMRRIGLRETAEGHARPAREKLIHFGMRRASGRCTRDQACMVRSMSFEFDVSGRSYYVPSSFYISAAPGVLDPAGNPLSDGWHRLMHEYAHLIQDRTSVFGAIDFMHFVDSLQSVLKLLKAQEDAATPRWARCAPARFVLKKLKPPLVHLPVSATENAADSWIASIHKLRAVTYPRKPWKNGVMWAFEEHRVEQIPIWYEGAERLIPVAVARFVDNVSGGTSTRSGHGRSRRRTQ